MYDKTNFFSDIEKFKNMGNNWDGYNGIPLESKSAENALLLYDIIGDKLFKNDTDVYPNPNGTLTIEILKNDVGEINIEIGNTSISYWIKFKNCDIVSTIYANEININNFELKQLINYINKYL